MRTISIAVGVALLIVAPAPARAADPAWHGNSPSSAPILGMEATPSGNGYLLLDAAGGVFAHGDAGYFGSLPELRRTNPAIGPAPVVDLSLTRRGQGYWVLDEAGGIFTFGAAVFRGSVPQLREQGVDIGPGRIIDLAPVGDRGYYLLDEHGGVFTFGDLQFHGSIPQLRSQGVDIGDAKPVALVPAGTDGYWMLDERGGVFAFGSAQFHGSGAGMVGERGAAALVPYPDGKGYYILETVGHIRGFGSAKWFGANTFPPPASAVDMAVHPDGTGYWVVANDGRVFTLPVRPPSSPQPNPPPPAPGPPFSPSPSIQIGDPAFDAAYCEGDITSAWVWQFTQNAMSWGVTLDCSSSLAGQQWRDGLTGPIFDVDVHGDAAEDYYVGIGMGPNWDSFLEYQVVRVSDGVTTCSGDAEWSGERDFWARISRACFGDPANLWVRSYMLWDQDPSDPDVAVDAAPDDEGFFGPLPRA